MPDNETKESTLIIKTAKLSSKSLDKLSKTVMRLNTEFDKSRKQDNDQNKTKPMYPG